MKLRSKTRTRSFKKVIVPPRPTPRYTRKDIQTKFYSDSPDPEYIVRTIREEISCLKSEKARLNGRNRLLEQEKGSLLEQNAELESALKDLVERTEYVNGEISQRTSELETLSKDLEQAHKKAEDMQRVLLSGQRYDEKLKEMRQLQLKKSATEKKLKDAKKMITKTDFANLKNELQLYQEDINTLDLNNMRIENQINLVTQQISKTITNADQRRLKKLVSAKDTEIQNLLQKIRDAKRRESLSESNDFLNSSLSLTATSLSGTGKSASFDDPSVGFNYVEEFRAMRSQIQNVSNAIDKMLSRSKKNPELIKLRSEVDTIAATIEAERRNLNQDSNLEDQCQMTINRVDKTLTLRKEELSTIQEETQLVQKEIDDIIKKRNVAIKEFDQLIATETKEVQQLLKQILHFCKKFEEDTDKLRKEEEELNDKKKQLTDIKASKEIAQYKEIIDQKQDVEFEIQQLKTSLRTSTGITESNREKIETTRKNKEKLQAKFQEYYQTLRADKEELDELENYANMLMGLIRTPPHK